MVRLPALFSESNSTLKVASTFHFVFVFSFINWSKMSSTLTCLPYPAQMFLGNRQRRTAASAPQSSSITTSTNLKWTEIKGVVYENLIAELQNMYWNGVKRELTQILLTLRQWQKVDFAETTLLDETDDFIHGFDTFVDQVSEASRDFAARYDKRVQNWKKGEQITWKQGLMEQGKDYLADWKSSRIKMDIRDVLAGR
jgi:hypothetical protein